MKILICGASGFVGRHLASALVYAGHEVIRGVHHAHKSTDIKIDYKNDIEIEAWLPRLAGIDAVVNAVGVLRDSPAQPMDCLHAAAPRALFAAAAQLGIKRIVQISALGVGTGINTPYMQTKESADELLQSLDLDWAILRPSLIYGEDGASTRMFMLLSRMPVVMLPFAGKNKLQPVHINDLAELVVKLLAPTPPKNSMCSIIECAGSEIVTMAELISSYSTQRGGRAPWIIYMPLILLNILAWLGDRIPSLPLGSDTLLMLEAGTIGNSGKMTELLEHEPLSYRHFIAAKL